MTKTNKKRYVYEKSLFRCNLRVIYETLGSHCFQVLCARCTYSEAKD